MSWSRMSFKGQPVWVNVGDDGKPILDQAGRAEMKYRETDQKTYKPSPTNLVPDAGAPVNAAKPTTRVAKSPAPVVPPAPSPAKIVSPLSGGSDVIHVWTDGACSGNPGPMGIGIVVISGATRKEHGEYLGKGTNNIAELTAIARGLEIAATVKPGTLHTIRVYTDSAYSIGLLQQGWKAKANQALVADLRRQVSAYPNIRFVKVAGHAGVPENERCDLLATQAVATRRPGT